MRLLLARVVMTLGWSLFLVAPALSQIRGGDSGGPPGITVNPTKGLITTEAGGTADFTIVLDMAPSANVTIGLSSSDPSEGTTIPDVTFTPANWNVPQTVTVTGMDDPLPDGNVIYMIVTAPAISVDPGYNGINPADVTLSNQDNDAPPPGVLVTPAGTLAVDENGGTADFTLALTTLPTNPVTIPLSVNDPSEGSLSTNSLVFSPFNGTTPQTVTLTGLDDGIPDGDITFMVITGDPSSQDPGYNDLDAGDVPNLNAVNGDNEPPPPPAGVNVSPQNLNTNEFGADDSFSVTLNTQPIADVSFPLSVDDPSEGSINPISLTFTNANWNVPQVVTVTGVDDGQVDGPQSYNVLTGATTSSDPDYSAINPPDVAVVNADNDSVAIDVIPSSIPLVTTESGVSDTFDVVLRSEPSGDVSVGLTVDDVTEGSINPSGVLFNPGNWNIPQTITVTGLDDSDPDGNISYNVITAPATSNDPNYNGIDPNDVSCRNDDDGDGTDVTVSPSGFPVITSEDGITTGFFDVVLNREPIADVTISFSSDNGAEGDVTPTSLVFTSANWNITQSATLIGVDDPVVDGDVDYSIIFATIVSSDTGYHGVQIGPVNCRNLDNDMPGVNVSAANPLQTSESGQTDSIAVSLSAEPLADVVFDIFSTNTNEGVVSGPSPLATLTFTPANWNIAQNLTVTGVDDPISDGDINYEFAFSSLMSSDPAFNGITPPPLPAVNEDNDQTDIIINAANDPLTTDEGGLLDVFTVVLGSEPTADVILSISSSDEDEGQLVVLPPQPPQTTQKRTRSTRTRFVSPIQLVFNSGNWNIPQAVQVVGQDDAVPDGDQPYTVITAPAVSSDPAYNGFDPIDLNALNMDNDNPAVIVIPNRTPLITDENGGADFIDVFLATPPSADVTVQVSTDNPAEGDIPAKVRDLTFTPANWDQPQNVVVVGVDDGVADGTVSYQVEFGPVTSNDPNYNGIPVADVDAINLDNDTAAINIITANLPLTTSEDAATDSFDVVLTAQPAAPVTLNIDTDDPDEGTIAPAMRQLTFDNANWNQPQTVTVVGVDDNQTDGPTPYLVVFDPAVSTDPAYNGQEPNDIPAVNLDNELAQILVIPSQNPLTTTEDGDSDFFDMVLSSQPSADVSIDVTSNNPDEGVIAKTMAQITFTPGNWDQPQRVVINGVDDPVPDGLQFYQIVTAPAVSSDPNYNGLDAPDLPAVNLDNDTAELIVQFQEPPPLITDESGLSTTFTVHLSTEPGADVNLPVAASDPTEGTAIPGVLTFTPTNWDNPQTITVTGVDDSDQDDDVDYDILLGPTSSVDPAYNGLTTPPIACINEDNDQIEILVIPAHSPLTTDENGLSDTITVVLASQPTADVSLNAASNNTAEGVVAASAATLIFTPANWDVPQVLTVTGVDDGQADGNVFYAVVFSPAVSNDPNYNGFDPDDISAVNFDNDSAGVLVVPARTPMETDEDGGFDTFAVSLTTEPNADVNIALDSSNPAEGILSSNQLIFTPADWNIPQIVTITGVDDQAGDGDVLYTILIGPVISNDPGYNGQDPADPTVINHDNDTSGIIVNPANVPLTTTESGGSDTIELILASQPLDDVFISVDSDNPAEGDVSQKLIQVVFTPTNWDSPQTVVVTGVDDGLNDGPQNYNIVLGPVTSNDPAYNGQNLPLVPAVNLDDDFATLIVQPSGLPLTTNENGLSAFIDLVLTSQPADPVSVPVTSSNTNEGEILPAQQIVFTPADWDQVQTVEVRGVDDPVQDGDTPYQVSVGPLISADTAYDGQTFPDLNAVNLDNDTAAILVFSAPQPLVTTEDGQTSGFEVVLSNQPIAAVDVPITSGDTSEGLLARPKSPPGSVINLVFTPTNWDQPQIVDIIPVDDGVVDGPVGYTIAVGPASSSDPAYDGLGAPDVGVLNVDTNIPGLIIQQERNPLTTSEAGLSDSFTIALAAAPTAIVTLDLASSDTSEGVVATGARQVSFTPSNWDQPQIITVNSVDDSDEDGSVFYTIVTSPFVSKDPNYSGLDPQDVDAVNFDDDSAGIAVVVENNPLITSEDGDSAAIDVVLTTQPSDDVSISISSSDPGEGQVDTGSLTFTDANWNTPQTVTVTGVDDGQSDGDIFYIIDFLPAVSNDPEYSGKDAGDLGALNLDNDSADIIVDADQIPLQTSEDGDSDSFTVVLSTEPSADVIIPVAADQPLEAVTDVTALTFTPSNWDQPQTVTVTGLDDAFPDGDALYLVDLGPVSSSDPAYDQFPVTDVPAVNIDNDSAAILVIPDNQPLMTSEDGDSDSFTVVLTSPPTADVTIGFFPSEPSETRLEMGSTLPPLGGGPEGDITLVFTPTDWDQPRVVNVIGIDDDFADGDVLHAIVSTPSASTDPNYQGIDPPDLPVINADNDEGAISVTPSQIPLITNEDGLQDSFTVVLTAQPKADVEVDITSSDPTEGVVSLSMTQIIFSPEDWNVPRTVQVIGQDDAISDGPTPYQIILPPVASADPAFDGVDPPDVDAVNEDNDGGTGGVIVLTKGPLITSEGGGSTGFGVVLGSQPIANVTVPLDVSDNTEAELFAGLVELVFTPTNWDQPRDIQVLGLDDDQLDGDVNYQILIGQVSSEDPTYDGIDPPDLDAVNLDNDGAQILVFVDHPLPLVTDESGGGDFFNIVLGAPPKSDVSIEIISSDTTEGIIPNTLNLVFTPADWDQPQSVQVVGVDDEEDDGPINYLVEILPAVSTDTDYNGLDANDLAAVNQDNDGAEIIVLVDHPLPLVTDESGGSDSFRVRLGSQPSADVSLDINTSDPTEGVIAELLTLVFTPQDWDQPRLVDVVGVDDTEEDGPVDYRFILSPVVSNDPNYNGIDPPDLDAVNNDNDGALIIVTLDHAPPLQTSEDGDSDFLSVALSTEPTANVTLDVQSSDLTEGILSQNLVLVFTPQNWDKPQTVEVTGVDDTETDGPVNYRVQILPAVSEDGRYDGQDVADLDAVNSDNDTPGIRVTAKNIPVITDETGASDLLEVRLTTPPTDIVLVRVASSDPSEGVVEPNVVDIIFTPTSWDEPQTVALLGVDDDIIDGPVNYEIRTGPAISDDPNYNGLTATPLPAINNDDDAAALVVIPDEFPVLVTDESGQTITGFTVALSSPPSDDVTIEINTSDATEGQVDRPPVAFGSSSPVIITFSTEDWDNPRRVDVTGVDDSVVDGDVFYEIVFAEAVSNDPAYDGVSAPPLEAVNRDDDGAAVLVLLDEQPMTTDESGDTAAFTLVLSSPPTSDVIIRAESSDTSEVVLSEDLVELVFTPADWDVPRAVVATGVDDTQADGPQDVLIEFEPVQSNDPNYNGVTIPPFQILNLDNDTAGIQVVVDGPLETTESGGSDTFTVVLTIEPTTNVLVPLASSDLTEGLVNPTSLLFTPSSWDTPRTVTVTGRDDNLADGPIEYNVLIGPAQAGDPNYDGLDPFDPLVINLEDNDQSGILIDAPPQLITHEGGGQAQFQASLETQPTSNVSLSIESSDTSEGIVSQTLAELIFTPENWEEPQIVIVTGVDDALEDGAVAYQIIINPAVSSDPAYNQVDPPDLSALNLDNEGAGIIVDPLVVDTFESNPEPTEFTINLSSPPTANVTIPLAVSDPLQADFVDGAPVLLFTPDNWNQPQAVELVSVDDDVDEGDDSQGTPYVVLLGPISSDDPSYAEFAPPPIPAFNFDNDTAQLISDTLGPLSTNESGANDDFSLRLNSQPTADVLIMVASSDPTEATVSPGMIELIFTPDDWDLPKRVIVNGVDDPIDDDNGGDFFVEMNAVSQDPIYDGLELFIEGFNTDNDAPVSFVSLNGPSTITEGGGATYTVSRTRTQGTASVTVSTTAGTATSGQDYNMVQQTINFNNGQGSASVNLSTIQDTEDEPDETLVLRLSGANGVSIDNGTVGITIIDDDEASTEPGVFSLAAPPVVDEGGVANVIVTRTGGSFGEVTVQLATGGGDATPGEDYQSLQQSITFADGQNIANTSVQILQDELVEEDESFNINLTDSNGGTDQTTVVIRDDDEAQPGIFNLGGPTSINEGESATYVVTRTGGVDGPASVTVTGGTPNDTAGSADYTFTASTLNFAPGDLTQSFEVTATEDDETEDNETFSLSLTAPTGGELGPNPRVVVTIIDGNSDQPLSVSWASPGQVVIEDDNGKRAVQVTVNAVLNASPSEEVSFNFGVGGSASAGEDHNLSPGSLVFAAGQTQAQITFQVIGDTQVEEDETIILSLPGPGENKTHVIRIEDNDQLRVRFAAPGQALPEGNGGTTTVSTQILLDAPAPQAVAVEFGVAGSADSADHNLNAGVITIAQGQTSATLTFQVFGDDVQEPDDTINIFLTGGDAVPGSPATHVVTILNDDQINLSWTQPQQTVPEPGPGEETGVSAVLVLSAPAAQPITVGFTVAGTAGLGTDHNLVGRSVTFAPGETQFEVFFDVLGDDLQEADETISLTLQGPADLITNPTHIVTIIDDDVLLANWSTDIQFVTEGDAAKRAAVTISAQLNGPTPQDMTLSFGVGGSAEAGTDHDLGASATLTFTAGSESASLTFNVLGDAVQEQEETIVLTLQPGAAAVGSQGVQTIVIEDDDQLLVAWSSGAVSVNEGDGKRRMSVTVSASLSQPAPTALSVPFNVNGTATPGEDHNLSNGVLNFPSGSDTADLTFEVLDDDIQEAQEVIVLSLGGTEVAVGQPAVLAVEIVDNDLNQAPETTITAPTPGATAGVGQSVTYAGSAVDPQGDPTTLSWEICASTGGCFTQSGETFNLTIDQPGVYNITCVASDDQGNQDQTPATVTINIEERIGPAVEISAPVGDVSITVGDTVNFTAQASGDNVQLAWFLISDPGVSLSSGTSFSRTFDEEGFFTVAVRATDDFGDTDTDSRTIEVSPPEGRDPVLTITSPAAGSTFTVGEEIQFSGSVSDPDNKRKAFEFFWTTGDGRTLDGESPTTAYPGAGNYQVRFAGVDGDILLEDTINIFIVADEPPVVDFNFPTDKEIQPADTSKDDRNSEIFFSAVVIDAQGHQNLSYFWDFGDNTTSRQETPGAKRYQAEGLYTVSLYATTPTGIQSDTVTRRIQVRRSTDETFEPNEDFQQAPILTPGNYENLLLDENSLDDFYRVQIVTAGQILTLRLNIIGNGLVEIYDVSRRLIRSRTISGEGSLQVRGLNPGDYFVRVGTAPGSKMGLSYSFGVAVLNPALYFPEIQVSESFDTQLGIVNTTNSAVSMEATGYDSRGNILGTVQLDLPALGRTHRPVTELFGANADNVAWVQVDSTAELIGYSRTSSRDRQELFSMNANKRLSSELYVPHIAENTQQWFTRAAVVNATNEQSTSDIQTGGDNTSALDVGKGFSKDSFDFLDKFDGALPQEDGLWASFKEQGDNLYLAGTEVFGTLDGTRIVAGLALDDVAQDNPNFTFRAKDIYFTHIAADSATFFTGLVLVNISDFAQTVRVIGYGRDGEQRGEKNLVLQPRQKLVQVAETFLEGIGTTQTVAWARIESDTEISGFELFGTRDGTRLAGIEAADALKSRICYPFIDSSGEVDHGITLVNVNQTTNKVAFKLYDDAGVLLREVARDLNPNQKFVSTLAALFPDLEPGQIAGWLDAVAELPVAGFEIFVDRGGQQMAGINAE